MTGAEEWRPVVGYEGFYVVSSLGRVMRVKRGAYAGRILKQQKTHNGYLKITLSKCDVQGTHRVHGVVAEAFLGPRPMGWDVNHIDRCKTNNAVTNLEYLSHIENMRYSANGGRGFRLTDDDVRTIRNLSATMNGVEIGRRFGMQSTHVTLILRGKSYGHVK